VKRSDRPFADEFRSRTAELAEFGVAALGPLYDLTARRLVRYASMIARQQQDAEDAVHTALTKLADRPSLLVHLDAPWPYLLRMVRNEALLLRRKQARVHGAHDLSQLLTYCRVDELEQEDDYQRIWQSLRKLPTEQSEVIALKLWEHMTFAQIAEVLVISPNTAASRYRYGLEKLAILLHEFAEAGHE
jgi:RNA polymerase sigma-70 factor (ECF subfamily)